VGIFCDLTLSFSFTCWKFSAYLWLFLLYVLQYPPVQYVTWGIRR